MGEEKNCVEGTEVRDPEVGNSVFPENSRVANPEGIVCSFLTPENKDIKCKSERCLT